MKTTLIINDAVMAQLKREALRQGRTISDLVEEALRLLLQPEKRRRGGHLVEIANRDALYQALSVPFPRCT